MSVSYGRGGGKCDWWADHLDKDDAEIGEGRQQLRRAEPQLLEQLFQRLQENDWGTIVSGFCAMEFY